MQKNTFVFFVKYPFVKRRLESLLASINYFIRDNILDYFNYVVVPALFLVEAQLLPPTFSLPGVVAILLASAYQFTQVDAKTDKTNEYFFKGFPDFWNLMVIYMLVLETNPTVNLIVLIVLTILIFVPIKYLYPTRTLRLKKLTLLLTIAFGTLGLVGLILYPNEPKWIWWVSLVYGAYYLGVSLWPHRSSSPAS